MKKLLLASVLALSSTVAFRSMAWTGNDWMSELPDNAYVAQVSIPGTHDSATGNGCTLESLSKTQALPLDKQLELGIRAFDFRPKVDGNTLNAQHGIAVCNITFDAAMKDVIAKFLNEHPTEFVVLHLLYADDFDKDKANYARLLKTLFESNELNGKAVAFRRDLTVGEMRGKILVLSRDRYADQPYFGAFMDNWSEEFNGVSDRSRIIGASGDEMNNSKLFVQDRAKTNGDNTEKTTFMTRLLDFTTRHNINGDPANLVWAFNFLSSYSNDPSTASSYKANATVFNKIFADYMGSASNMAGPAGLVMMDQVGTDETNGNASVKAVIDNNFKYLVNTTEATAAKGETPQFRLDKAWLQADGMYYSCGGDKALPIIADFDGDGRMDFYCSGQSWECDDNNNWNWGDASYMAFNKGFGHPYGFEAYDNSGVKRGEPRDASNKEDFLPIVYGAQVRALADLNQDGAVDFMLWDCDQHGWGTYQKHTPWGDPNNHVLINNGNGSKFSMIEGYPNNIANNKHNDWGCSLPGKYHRLSVADANGDGYPDILMVTENGTYAGGWYDKNGTSLFINNGDNTFERKYIASNRNTYATSIFGDFNCDGYPDILLNGWHDAITDDFGNTIDGGWELVIMTNDGKGNFSLAYHSNAYGKNDDNGKETAIHVIDYDQDGKQDILLIGTTNSNSFNNSNGRDAKVAFILRNESDGTGVKFSEVLTDLHAASEAMARTSILADFNGDGFVDYLADGWGLPKNDWSNGSYLSYSQGKYNNNYGVADGVIKKMNYNDEEVDEEQCWITFGDIDGDGMLDIISPNGSNAPRIYLNRTLEGKNQVPQVPAAPENLNLTFDNDKNRVNISWDKMTTPSGSKAVYNTYIRPVNNDGRAITKTFMRVPANIETGKLKAYSDWSSFLPDEKCFFENLEDGQYEVGVQSVGYNYGASKFTTQQFTVSNGGITTGINGTIAEEMKKTVNVYNMQGILVRQGVERDSALDGLSGGIYIVNGKKILKR